MLSLFADRTDFEFRLDRMQHSYNDTDKLSPFSLSSKKNPLEDDLPLKYLDPFTPKEKVTFQLPDVVPPAVQNYYFHDRPAIGQDNSTPTLKKRALSELSLDIEGIFDSKPPAKLTKYETQADGSPVKDSAFTQNVAPIDIKTFKRNMIENMNVRTPITRWTEHEEVILQGIVIDCNLVHGTQASWTQIAECYSIATDNFAKINNLSPIRARTSCALKKHYRVMHNRIRDGEVTKDFWYQVYHSCWTSDSFNKKHKLIDYSEV